MEFRDNLPIYIQIGQYIKEKIINGKLKEADKLPSVRKLSTDLKVNPNTIQRSYQELEREGIVFTKRGRGTFVTKDKEILKELKSDMASDLVKSFLRGMETLGLNRDEIINLIDKEMEGDRND